MANPEGKDRDENLVREMKRAARARSLDEEIGRRLAEAAESGELGRAKHYGQPMPADDGWNDTPAELRMGFKILKGAGVVPAEVEWFHERARLRSALEACPGDEERAGLRRKLEELEQKIALRLEALRAGSGL